MNTCTLQYSKWITNKDLSTAQGALLMLCGSLDGRQIGGSPEVAGFKPLFIRCIEYLKHRLRLQTSHKKRSHPECWISSFGSETPAGGPNPLPGRRRRSATLGIERARAGAGSSLIAVFPPSCLPGEFSREKPGEDGRALFFGVRQWRRLRRWGRES